MRILHVHNVANVGATLVEGLQRIGHLAELRKLQLAGSRHYSAAIKLLYSPTRLLEFAKVNRYVKANAFDIVHIHYAYLGWIGITGGYPYYLHCHGTDVRLGLNHPLRRWPVIQSLKRARKVMFVTPDLAPLIHPIRPDAIFLPNPVNTEKFRPSSQRENYKPRILINSSMKQSKRVDIAFEAVKLLHQDYPDIEVTAIDIGPDREKFRNIPRINFVPPVDHNCMADFINSHDIIMGQFGIGSLGMAEMETMACGKPVICYFDYQDWYSEAPPVFSAKEPEVILQYLLKLINDSNLRQERGQMGLKWIHSHQDFKSVARRLEQIYLE